MSRPLAGSKELLRYPLQLGGLQKEMDCLAIFIVTDERVGMPRLLKTRDRWAYASDLGAACEARLVFEWSLWVRVAHAWGVSSGWLNNR